jgi:hypothetical protein
VAIVIGLNFLLEGSKFCGKQFPGGFPMMVCKKSVFCFAEEIDLSLRPVRRAFLANGYFIAQL